MPCNSDYLEPRTSEKQTRKAAELICFVRRNRGMPIDRRMEKAAEHIYGEPATLNEVVVELCRLLNEMDASSRDTLIYDARSKTARDLADWWEEHLEADRARETKEAEEQRRQVLRQSALAKLTTEEARAFEP